MAFASWTSDRYRSAGRCIECHNRKSTSTCRKPLVMKSRMAKVANTKRMPDASSGTLRRHRDQQRFSELSSSGGKRISSVTTTEPIQHRQQLARPRTVNGAARAHGRLSLRHQANEGGLGLRIVATAQPNLSIGRGGVSQVGTPLRHGHVSCTHRDRNRPKSRYWPKVANDRKFGNDCVN